MLELFCSPRAVFCFVIDPTKKVSAKQYRSKFISIRNIVEAAEILILITKIDIASQNDLKSATVNLDKACNNLNISKKILISPTTGKFCTEFMDNLLGILDFSPFVHKSVSSYLPVAEAKVRVLKETIFPPVVEWSVFHSSILNNESNQLVRERLISELRSFGIIFVSNPSNYEKSIYILD